MQAKKDIKANPIRLMAIHGFNEGDTFSYSRTFTREETLSFGDMTRDYNPVHYDPRWAENKGFKDLICHGLLAGAMVCEFGGQVGWLATGMNYKFINPVYAGDTVQCNITINKIEENGRAEAEAIFINQDGEQVCYATLTGRLPMEKDRDLLRQMIDEGDAYNKLSEKEYGFGTGE